MKKIILLLALSVTLFACKTSSVTSTKLDNKTHLPTNNYHKIVDFAYSSIERMFKFI